MYDPTTASCILRVGFCLRAAGARPVGADSRLVRGARQGPVQARPVAGVP